MCAAGLFLQWYVHLGRRRASDRAVTKLGRGSSELTVRYRCLSSEENWNALLEICQILRHHEKVRYSHFMCFHNRMTSVNVILYLRETYCLNFWSTLWSGVPSTSWILATWSNSLVPGNRGFKLQHTNTPTYTVIFHNHTVATKLFTPLTYPTKWI